MKEKIQLALEKFPKAKKIAVENFCYSSANLNKLHTAQNEHTQRAIKQVLDL